MLLQVYVVYREGVKVLSALLITLSVFLFQLLVLLCLQCWVLEGNAHAVLISECCPNCAAAWGYLFCYLRKCPCEPTV